MLIELLFDLRISQASGCFSGTRGPSRGPAVAGDGGFGKLSSRGGGSGFALELGVFPLVPLMLLTWDIFFFFFLKTVS